MGDFTNKMGLATWDQPLDRYDYFQLSNNWQIIDFHDHSPGRGVQIGAAGISAGAVNLQHLAPVMAQDLGLNASGSIGRGYVYNPGPGTRANTVLGNLSDAADQVTGIVLNTGGLINVGFHALWSVTSGGTAFASLILNGNAVIQGSSINNANSYAQVNTTATLASPLYSQAGVGLASTASTTTAQTEITTGSTIGGVAHIYIPNPGTYTVAVQYSTSAGTYTVTASNRRLWVWSMNF